MTESEAEDLYLGASHVDKIGKIVCVDIEGNGKVATVGIRGGLCGPRENRVIITGVLHGTEDHYGKGGDPEGTSLTIGEVTVFIDWSDEPHVEISVITN
jgi:hypothetical protein